MDSASHVLYSNRSAAYASLKQWKNALIDAERATEYKGDWAKGWGRKGAALLGLGQVEEAKVAYEKGLELEPNNDQLRRGLEAVLATSPKSSTRVENPFADPMMWERLKADPKMAEHLKDPNFVKMIEEIKGDPKSLMKHIRDPRVSQAFATMLGVEIKSNTAAESGAGPSQTETKEGASQGEKVSTRAREEPSSEPQINAEALREKELGNEAYKKRDFDVAIHHYDAAIQLDPENVSLLTNKSAVLFEQGKFEECIKLCEEAVNKGRDTYADFKLIGRALARIGSCHERMGDLEQAISYYQKSLMEHRSAEVLTKQMDAERRLMEAKKSAYHNPQLAEEARANGNDHFKKGEFAEAVKCYTEAIKRDEKDPRAYSNRAACYTKLTAIPEGLRDCEKAISLDSHFVKAYIRKAALLHLKRDYALALAALDQASNVDEDGKNGTEIQQLRGKIYSEMRRANASESEEEIKQRAMNNPEVREIMADPVMRQILGQMQEDPRAAQEHLKNPAVMEKISKLIAAGVIKTS